MKIKCYLLNGFVNCTSFPSIEFSRISFNNKIKNSNDIIIRNIINITKNILLKNN